MRESHIEKYLKIRVEGAGGEVRKVQWIGRRNAPDRVVLMPPGWRIKSGVAKPGQPGGLYIWWVELKSPKTIKTFPANAHERAQYREHERMRKLGQRVEVIGTFEQVDALFA